MVCYSSCPVTCIAVKTPQKIFEKFIDDPNNDFINMGFVEKKLFIFLMIGKIYLLQTIIDNLWQPGTYIGCIF